VQAFRKKNFPSDRFVLGVQLRTVKYVGPGGVSPVQDYYTVAQSMLSFQSKKGAIFIASDSNEARYHFASLFKGTEMLIHNCLSKPCIC
jgi:hypothetical protein